MKICYDTLKNVYLTKNKNRNFRKGRSTLVYRDNCAKCGEPYLTPKDRPSEFCCTSCAQKGKKFTETHLSNLCGPRLAIRGKNNPNWRGGVTNDKLPLYDTFINQLNLVEETKVYINKDGLELLQVRCSKCRKWFVPTRNAVTTRIRCLNVFGIGEGRFYCSDKCIGSCEVYRKNPNLHLEPKNNSRSVQFATDSELIVWSQKVMKRANYKCEICGDIAEHTHHIQPKKLEPGLILDPDNGLAVCKICHYKYGHKGKCSLNALGKVNNCD
jgi:hypothetical protein